MSRSLLCLLERIAVLFKVSHPRGPIIPTPRGAIDVVESKTPLLSTAPVPILSGGANEVSTRFKEESLILTRDSP